MDLNALPLQWIFAALTVVGVLYFAVSLFFGGDADTGMDDGGEIGCTLIAAFFAVFGAIGLLGVLSSWSLPVTLVVAAVAGVVIGRGLMAAMRLVIRQQSTTVTRDQDLIGSSARVTIDTPEGRTGEALLEGETVGKYPVREINGAALHRNDHVDVVDVHGGILLVKRKRG